MDFVTADHSDKKISIITFFKMLHINLKTHFIYAPKTPTKLVPK